MYFDPQVNNYTAVALTKLDILDGFDEIQIGVEYIKDGKTLDHFPSSEQVQHCDDLLNKVRNLHFYYGNNSTIIQSYAF